MDPARLLYGSRSPLLVGAMLGFLIGALASMAIVALYAALTPFEIGNLTPMFALAYGACVGVVVGIVVAVALRRRGD